MKNLSIWFTEPYKKKLNIILILMMILVGICLWLAIDRSGHSATHSLFNVWGWLAILFGGIMLAISIVMMVKALKEKQRPLDIFFGVKEYMSKEERKALIVVASCYYLIMLMIMFRVGNSRNIFTYTPYAIPFTIQIIYGIKLQLAKKKRESATDQF